MTKLIKIPRNIFQTWEIKDISEGFKLLTQSWTTKNQNYAYFLFDDNERKQFIKKNFDERIYDTYCRIIPGAFRADLWRYCILYIYGGVYVDIDTLCFGSLDLFLTEDVEFMAPIDLNNCPYLGKYNLSNGFIASVAKHPILLNCIYNVVSNVENNIVPFSNLDFSGPGVLGKSTNKFLNLNEETSFIGKEGIINNVKLLKFCQGIEYVMDTNENVLFQNKNGNEYIQQIYEEEIKKIKYVCWGTCKNPIKPKEPTNEATPTIITMFYNIREKEGNNPNSPLNRGVKKYCDLAKNFILSLPYNLIVFTDNEEVIEFVKKERENLKDKTQILNKKFEETYYYKHLDILNELQQKFNIINGNVKQETPMYIVLNNNKFDFMETAIKINPFNSKHFIWMDFGINHVALNTEIIHEWIHAVPDKIKQLCINPYIENVDDKTAFQYIYHHMAGGLFSGSSENLLKYCELFKQKTEQIYKEDWYQIDEAVMTMVNRENPELFDLFYGDYQGIISNYLYPINNIDLILKGVQKYIDANKTREAYRILSYCHKYFETRVEGEYVFCYINQRLIVDYYNNDKLIVEGVVNLINLLKIHNPERILHLLDRNKSNIHFYGNSHLIL